MATQRDYCFRTVSRVLDAVEIGAIAIDRNGKIVYLNDRVCKLVGRDRKELIGSHIYEISKTQSGRAQLDAVIKHSAEPASSVIVVSCADGPDVSIGLTGRMLSDEPPLNELRILTFEDRSAHEADEKKFRERFGDLARLSDTAIEQAIALKHHSEELEGRVRQRTLEIHQANMDSVVMLAVASEAKDADTGAHVRRIQHYVEATARRMGLSKTDAEQISYSSMLHDVGKIHIPDRILRKPGALTTDEREIMQTHTLIGEQILSQRPFFDIARQITRLHHENWDGSGYPDGVSRGDIPLCARIVRTADVFDALTSKRVYKSAWPVEDVVSHLQSERGRSFDPKVVDVFVSLVADGSFEHLFADRRPAAGA